VAASNWQAPDLTREQRIAATVLHRTGLAPPVEVQEVAAHFADLDEDRIPGECDGLILGLHRTGRERPLIIVERTSSERRKRFTVAHELGHFLLPWHQGTASACDVTSFDAWNERDSQARRAETEANRFASALLLPPAWIDDIVASAGPGNISQVLKELQAARVSAYPLCIAASGRLPPGHMFVIADSADVADLSGSSPDSSAELPRTGSKVDFKRLDRFAHERVTLRVGGRYIHWWIYTTRKPKRVDEERSSRQVLDGLLTRHSVDSEHASRLRQSFGGIAGSAKSMSAGPGGRASSDQVYARLLRAFAKHREEVPDTMLDDPDFDLWLRMRALEVSDD
jgi:hypothetical protein